MFWCLSPTNQSVVQFPELSWLRFTHSATRWRHVLPESGLDELELLDLKSVSEETRV